MLKLLRATILLVLRDKEALFWTMVFPVIFIFIFSFFDFGGSVNARILLIDNAKNEASTQLVDDLQKIKGIGINTKFSDKETAKIELEKSKNQEFKYSDKTKKQSPNVVMIIPDTYGKEGTIELLYDQSEGGQASPSGIIEGILDQRHTTIALQTSNTKVPYAVKREGISVHDIDYFDTLVPGVVGMGVMQSGVIGMAMTIATLKEKRVLKRLSVTPLPIWKFLLAEVITYLLINLMQVTIMLSLSIFVLGANVYGSIPLMYAISIGSSFIFLSIGFFCGALSKTANAANSLSSVFSTPMMFLSGVFIPRESLPGVVKTISDFLPLSPVLDALRAVSLQDASIGDIKKELLMIFVWTIVIFLAALKTFKFREE